jgi:hypothetical protein
MNTDLSKWNESSVYWHCTNVGIVSICSLVLLLSCVAPSLLVSAALGEQMLSLGSESLPPTENDMKIDVLSSHTVHAIAGQFIKIEGIITKLNQSNSSNETNRCGLTYQ